MIYAIREQHNTDADVKIGFTADASSVGRRLSAIQTGNPKRLFVLWCGEGSKKDERALHNFLHPISVGGEWFRGHPGLSRFIHHLAHGDTVFRIAVALGSLERHILSGIYRFEFRRHTPGGHANWTDLTRDVFSERLGRVEWLLQMGRDVPDLLKALGS